MKQRSGISAREPPSCDARREQLRLAGIDAGIDAESIAVAVRILVEQAVVR